MRTQTARRLARGLWVVSVTLSIAGLAFLWLSRRAAQPAGFGFRGFNCLFALVFASVGALVASRRPANPIGWMLCASGILSAIQGMSHEYAILALIERRGALPLGEVAAWPSSWVWVPAVSMIAPFTVLLFPNGRLPSPRWRPVMWLSIVIVGAGSLLLAVGAGPLDNFPLVDNPFGLGPEIPRTVRNLEVQPLGLVIALSAISMVVRFRRSRGEERLQLKWFAYGSVCMGIAFGAGTPLYTGVLGKLYEIVVIAATLLVPLSVGVAILRYRLYDIDRLINRTLVYGVLSAGVAGVYALGVVLLGRLFQSFTRGSNLAIAISTLAVAGMFGPARRRVQAFIDRRFDRARYDAARTIQAFTHRMRQQLDLDTLTTELEGVVSETMQPAHVTLWLRRDPGRS